LAADPIAATLTRGVIGEPTVNLELHGLDLLDVSDGLDALRPHQPDARVPLADKQRRLSATVSALKEAGYTFVRMDELARRALP
jgi:hypothetical protein